jgi:hypothetical protein
MGSKGGIARVEDAHPMVASVDGMGHQDVQRGEVMRRVVPKQRPERLFADADVQSKDPVAVEI